MGTFLETWKFVKEGGYADRCFRNLINEALKWKRLRTVWLLVWEEIPHSISKAMKDQSPQELQTIKKDCKLELGFFLSL